MILHKQKNVLVYTVTNSKIKDIVFDDKNNFIITWRGKNVFPKKTFYTYKLTGEKTFKE